MAAEPAGVPQWKLDMIQRRKQEEEAERLKQNQGLSWIDKLVDESVPAWKKEVTMRKQRSGGSTHSTTSASSGGATGGEGEEELDPELADLPEWKRKMVLKRRAGGTATAEDAKSRAKPEVSLY